MKTLFIVFFTFYILNAFCEETQKGFRGTSATNVEVGPNYMRAVIWDGRSTAVSIPCVVGKNCPKNEEFKLTPEILLMFSWHNSPFFHKAFDLSNGNPEYMKKEFFKWLDRRGTTITIRKDNSVKPITKTFRKIFSKKDTHNRNIKSKINYSNRIKPSKINYSSIRQAKRTKYSNRLKPSKINYSSKRQAKRTKYSSKLKKSIRKKSSKRQAKRIKYSKKFKQSRRKKSLRKFKSNKRIRSSFPAQQIDNYVPVSSENSDNYVPVSAEQPENNNPVSSEQSENYIPVSAEQPENNNPVSAEQPENYIPVSSEQSDNYVPVSAEQPENYIPVSAEQSENYAPMNRYSQRRFNSERVFKNKINSLIRAAREYKEILSEISSDKKLLKKKLEDIIDRYMDF